MGQKKKTKKFYRRHYIPKFFSGRNFNDPIYKKWRRDVYTRDNYECQWPNCNCKKKLNAHHILRWSDHPGLRYNVSNGITLCKKHHDMIRGCEDGYVEYFLKILEHKSR